MSHSYSSLLTYIPFTCCTASFHSFFLFWPLFSIWSSWGQGSDRSHSCDLHRSCDDARSYSPPCRAGDLVLCSDAAEVLPIPLHHSENSQIIFKVIFERILNNMWSCFCMWAGIPLGVLTPTSRCTAGCWPVSGEGLGTGLAEMYRIPPTSPPGRGVWKVCRCTVG